MLECVADVDVDVDIQLTKVSTVYVFNEIFIALEMTNFPLPRQTSIYRSLWIYIDCKWILIESISLNITTKSFVKLESLKCDEDYWNRYFPGKTRFEHYTQAFFILWHNWLTGGIKSIESIHYINRSRWKNSFQLGVVFNIE